MSHLYWSCLNSEAETLLTKLRSPLRGQIETGLSHDPAVILIKDPNEELIAETIEMIEAGVLKSSVLVEHRLSPEDLWIAAEWWKRFLVDESLFPMTGISASAYCPASA